MTWRNLQQKKASKSTKESTKLPRAAHKFKRWAKSTEERTKPGGGKLETGSAPQSSLRCRVSGDLSMKTYNSIRGEAEGPEAFGTEGIAEQEEQRANRLDPRGGGTRAGETGVEQMWPPPSLFWKHPCHPAGGGAGCRHVPARSRGLGDSRAAYFQQEPGEKPRRGRWQRLNAHRRG